MKRYIKLVILTIYTIIVAHIYILYSKTNITIPEDAVEPRDTKTYPTVSWLFSRQSFPREGVVDKVYMTQEHVVPVLDSVGYEFPSINGSKPNCHQDLGCNGTGGILLSETLKLPIWDVLDYYKPVNIGPVCDKYFLVIVIKSAVINIELREAIRSTWGNTTQYLCKIKTFYILGKSASEDAMLAVEKEKYKYHDIIEGDFMDDYKNNTLKRIYGIQMAADLCKFRFLVATDDDTFVNIPVLVDNLSAISNITAPLYMGYGVADGSIVYRRTASVKSSWDVTKAEFPFFRYPEYISGFSGIFSRSAVDILLHHYKYVPSFPVDDAFVGYVLARAKVNAVRVFSGQIVSLFAQAYDDICKYNMAIIHHCFGDKFLRRYEQYFNKTRAAYVTCHRKYDIFINVLKSKNQIDKWL